MLVEYLTKDIDSINKDRIHFSCNEKLELFAFILQSHDIGFNSKVNFLSSQITYEESVEFVKVNKKEVSSNNSFFLQRL